MGLWNSQLSNFTSHGSTALTSFTRGHERRKAERAFLEMFATEDYLYPPGL
jgi:hypothetical protein